MNDGSSELSEMPNENLLKRILKLYERTGNKPSSLTMQSLQKAWRVEHPRIGMDMF